MKNKNLIICPYCDTEYLPGEIFLPNHFLGQPTGVERDYTGKILFAGGLDQDISEKFICVNCQKTFAVKANIQYVVSKNNVNMSQDYVSEKYPNRIILKED